MTPLRIKGTISIPFAFLQYEQRNKMFPHQIYTRRNAGDS